MSVSVTCWQWTSFQGRPRTRPDITDAWSSQSLDTVVTEKFIESEGVQMKWITVMNSNVFVILVNWILSLFWLQPNRKKLFLVPAFSFRSNATKPRMFSHKVKTFLSKYVLFWKYTKYREMKLWAIWHFFAIYRTLTKTLAFDIFHVVWTSFKGPVTNKI